MITHKIRAYVVLIALRKFLNKQMKVLDIGCGSGIITNLIEKRFKCDILGVDVLDYADDINFKKISDPYKLPFNNNAFDRGLLIDTLHHIENQEKAILEALRVCKKVFIFDIEPGFWAWFTDNILNLLTNKEMNNSFNNRTVKGWIKLFEKMNIKYTKVNFNKPLWYPLPQFCFRLEK